MQKIVPWCLVRIFDNELSWSTPLDPLMFRCISFCLGAFGTVLQLHDTCYKTRQTGAINAKVHATKSCRNFSQRRSRSTLLDPKLMFWCVSFRLGTFVTVSLLHETWCNTRQTGAVNVKVLAKKSCHNFSQQTITIHTIGPKTHVLVCCFLFGCICVRFSNEWKRAKLVQLMQKFVPRSQVRIFRNKHSWSTPLDPKHMFWCVSLWLGAFVTVLLLHETCCKTRQTGAINAKVRATMSC